MNCNWLMDEQLERKEEVKKMCLNMRTSLVKSQGQQPLEYNMLRVANPKERVASELISPSFARLASMPRKNLVTDVKEMKGNFVLTSNLSTIYDTNEERSERRTESVMDSDNLLMDSYQQQKPKSYFIHFGEQQQCTPIPDSKYEQNREQRWQKKEGFAGWEKFQASSTDTEMGSDKLLVTFDYGYCDSIDENSAEDGTALAALPSAFALTSSSVNSSGNYVAGEDYGSGGRNQMDSVFSFDYNHDDGKSFLMVEGSSFNDYPPFQPSFPNSCATFCCSPSFTFPHKNLSKNYISVGLGEDDYVNHNKVEIINDFHPSKTIESSKSFKENSTSVWFNSNKSSNPTKDEVKANIQVRGHSNSTLNPEAFQVHHVHYDHIRESCLSLDSSLIEYRVDSFESEGKSLNSSFTKDSLDSNPSVDGKRTRESLEFDEEDNFYDSIEEFCI